MHEAASFSTSATSAIICLAVIHSYTLHVCLKDSTRPPDQLYTNGGLPSQSLQSQGWILTYASIYQQTHPATIAKRSEPKLEDVAIMSTNQERQNITPCINCLCFSVTVTISLSAKETSSMFLHFHLTLQLYRYGAKRKERAFFAPLRHPWSLQKSRPRRAQGMSRTRPWQRLHSGKCENAKSQTPPDTRHQTSPLPTRLFCAVNCGDWQWMVRIKSMRSSIIYVLRSMDSRMAVRFENSIQTYPNHAG